MSKSNNDYFAIDATLSELTGKIEDFAKQIRYAGYDSKYRKSFSYYFGYGYFSRSDSLVASGDRGEETRVMVNSYRNLLRYQLALVTSDRPALDVVPTNTDYDAMASAVIGEEVLEYYMKSKKLEDHLKDVVEKAIYSAEGYIALSWDTKAGEFYGVDEDGKPVPEGDIKFSTYAAWDVIRDLSFTPSESNWMILRDITNKHDLAERFPEHKDEILDLSYQYNPHSFVNPNTFSEDACEVYTFYHKKTPALPEGKLVVFTENTKLLDMALPYYEVPVYRVAPSELAGTNLGYTDAFDILGLQEATDELNSAVVTNNVNHAKQCIVVPKDYDFDYRDLADGAALIEVDPDVAQSIRPLQLTASSPETYNLIQKLETEKEKLTGINDVIRGDPAASLRSGNALALVAAQSLKFNSNLQHSYTRLLEDVGTAVLKFLQNFAATPRFFEVVGKQNRTFLKSFDQDSLLGVSKVSAEVANPLSKTLAGRVQIAENLLQQGLITAQQYMDVLDSGKLEPALESERTERLLIRRENEMMQEGQTPPALITDNHELHIKEHRAVLDDPDARLRPEVVQATLAHIQEHEALWEQVSMRPAILMATQQQPAPMPQMPQQGASSGVMQPAQAGESQNPDMPNLPQAPAAASPQDQQAVAELNAQAPM